MSLAREIPFLSTGMYMYLILYISAILIMLLVIFYFDKSDDFFIGDKFFRTLQHTS